MLSRVAESCFWLHRYMERVENVARMLEVNRTFIPDGNLPEYQRWHPMIVVAGEEGRFVEKHGLDALADGEAIQSYLTWDEECPVSLQASLLFARQNARTIRETISLEMWECLNSFWLWLTGRKAKQLYQTKRAEFYHMARDQCQLFHGVCHNTILHEEPFDFMRLGMLLERAAQTSRLLDVHHHLLKDMSGPHEASAATAQWLAILKSCSAFEAILKKQRKPLTGMSIAEFLILEENFPRSIRHCVLRAWNFLGRIKANSTLGAKSEDILSDLVEHVRSLDSERIEEFGLHEELTYLVERTADVCHAIHEDYFDLSSQAFQTPVAVDK